MYKISALRETGNKNKQIALLSTIASAYSFDECKSFGFNINRNRYDCSKISNNIETIVQLLNDSAISPRFNKKNNGSKYSSDNIYIK
ncbi:hypothetical protein K502DRAFT_354121 [Neoconidiobolus thromboides FSU 785]|nr:hypothetical protein K502DRAFT_354121 [Neoconidiobolus thromboides FSU 785]